MNDRQRAVLSALAREHDAAAMVVTSLPNVAWLTGFTGSNGAVLLSADSVVLATDGRYRDQATYEAPDAEIVIDRAPSAALLRHAARTGIDRVAFETESVTVGLLAAWEQQVADFGLSLVPVGGIFEPLRMIKDKGEIALLTRACDISIEALQIVMPMIRVGLSEVELARLLELEMARAGASDRSFPTIVAGGANSAIPHHQPTSRTLEAGDLLKIDFGALVRGYSADCTRTFIVAAEPAPWQEEIHNVVCAAAAAGRAAMIAGAGCAEVDAAARNVVVRAGYGEAFTHGLGHGVGVEIHEAPLFAATTVGTLAPGVVATIEPGIYLPGRGGVRIEDTCLVTDGPAQVLTALTRELLRVG